MGRTNGKLPKLVYRLEKKAEIPFNCSLTGKFGLGVWNEAGQRLIEFCQENALVLANTFFQQHKRRPTLVTLNKYLATFGSTIGSI